MELSADESLDRLKGMHRDLVDLTESRLPNIDRLLVELEDRVEELRNLLDKPKKNDKSRQTLSSGMLELHFQFDYSLTVFAL